MLPKITSLTAGGQAFPPDLGFVPLVSTVLWCVIFIILAMMKFEKMEF
jgi:hypothetical protein